MILSNPLPAPFSSSLRSLFFKLLWWFFFHAHFAPPQQIGPKRVLSKRSYNIKLWKVTRNKWIFLGFYNSVSTILWKNLNKSPTETFKRTSIYHLRNIFDSKDYLKIYVQIDNIKYAFQLLPSGKLSSTLPQNSPVFKIRKKEVGANRKCAFEDFKRAQTLNECPSSLSSLRFTHLHHHTHILK